MTMLVKLVLASLPLLAVYLFQRLYYLRKKQFAEWPQLPPSLVWGHMKALNEFIQRGETTRHVDTVFREIREHLGNPPVFLLDVRPAQQSPLGIVCTPDVAEQVTKSTKSFPYSMGKSPTISAFADVLGATSIVASQGEEWKTLRKRFNPGFAPQHLLSLLPCILDRAWRFLENLDAHVRTRDEFRLEELCVNVTFDIIGAVTMDEDFRAQFPADQQSEFVTLFRQLVLSYSQGTVTSSVWGRIEKIKSRYHRRKVTQQLEALLKDRIQRKFTEKTQSAEKPGKRSRSILSLSLQDIDQLTPQILDQTCDQLKTFLFAGHDTTSILLQWSLYELSRTPRALNAIRTELDQLFGSDPSPCIVRDMLLSENGGDLLRRMSYVSAVIKETLRLYPPSGSARYQSPGSGFTVTLPDGKPLCLDNVVVYNCDTMVQRDETVYGETKDEFVPERWLGNTDTSMETNADATSGAGSEKPNGTTTGKIPASAWRPFERGPRNCIGQEMANLEARVILACAVRRYDFTKVGLGAIKKDGVSGEPVVNARGQYEVETELFNTMQVTAKPADGTRVRVSLAPGASAL